MRLPIAVEIRRSVMLRLPAMLWMVFFCSVPFSLAGDDAWESLFDGKTLNGWNRAALGKARYEVIDGAIQGTTLDGSPNTFLASDREFADFELELEVRVDDELNSGIQVRSRERTTADIKQNGGKGELGRFHGPQVEIEKSPGQSGFIYGEATGYGWLSPEPRQKPEASHTLIQNGEWNHYRIVAVGPRIQTWINGRKVADLTHEGIYKTHPTGKIGLQVHGISRGTGPYRVAWKNIRIKQQ